MTRFDHILLVLTYASSVLGFAFAIVLIASAQKERRPPTSTMAWLLGMIFIPYLGIPLYLLLHGRKLRQIVRRKSQLHLYDAGVRSRVEATNTVASAVHRLSGGTAIAEGNRIEHLTDGIVTFERFLELIRNARESINITTFIFARDDVGKAIRDELCERARAGVKVRLLLDAVGCWASCGSFMNPLREAGGRVGVFMPVIPTSRKWAANLRNHRKIFVVDGHTGILGGMNFGSEYMGPTADPKRWVDYSLLVEGPAARTLLQVFAADWKFTTEEPEMNILDPVMEVPPEDEGKVPVHIVASGPDTENDAFYDVVVSSLFSAKTRIWIATPYFVPDETIMTMLTIIARLGRDVRLVVPKKGDGRLVDLARRYYLREVARAGVKVYFYKPTMMHSKLILIDDLAASIGSPNMDMRSLYLNFEVTAFIYSRREIQFVEGKILEYIEQSQPFTDRMRRLRNRPLEALENIARLLSPLL